MNNMENQEKQTNSLFKIAEQGHYILFEPEWIRSFETYNKQDNDAIVDQEEAQKVLVKISKYASLEKKRIFLHSLTSEVRQNFLLYFFQKVENQIQRKKNLLQ